MSEEEYVQVITEWEEAHPGFAVMRWADPDMTTLSWVDKGLRAPQGQSTGFPKPMIMAIKDHDPSCYICKDTEVIVVD